MKVKTGILEYVYEIWNESQYSKDVSINLIEDCNWGEGLTEEEIETISDWQVVSEQPGDVETEPFRQWVEIVYKYLPDNKYYILTVWQSDWDGYWSNESVEEFSELEEAFATTTIVYKTKEELEDAEEHIIHTPNVQPTTDSPNTD